MLRHTFVTTMLDAGVDLRDVQIAARHADPRTTMRYDNSRELHQPGEVREVCPASKGLSAAPTAQHCSFVTWDYVRTSPSDARSARQAGKIIQAIGSREP
jgi:Phage integrase family